VNGKDGEKVFIQRLKIENFGFWILDLELKIEDLGFGINC
jgi:hypothetical protein